MRYPILPKVTRLDSEAGAPGDPGNPPFSLYAPRDFNISPYFEVVKPTIRRGFDYKAMAWADVPASDADEMVTPVPAEREPTR